MREFVNEFVSFVQESFSTSEFIPLHQPTFTGAEKGYVQDTLDSTFVSSVGKYVDMFEGALEKYTGSRKAIATVNGTAALHSALFACDVGHGDYVITQALTFVATCNAIHHLGAEPVFVDIDRATLGMCPKSLEHYLQEFAEVRAGVCVDRKSGRVIKAVVPMHTFGHPVDIIRISDVCQRWCIALVEDAAESLGSFVGEQHTGTFGRFGAISFNGNKIITTGGGGMVLCSSESDGDHLKHITTTAKMPHAYEFFHDQPAFNYRLPNLNAALGCAQLEQLSFFIDKKRELANQYRSFFSSTDYEFVVEPDGCRSNYWLNAIVCPDSAARNDFLKCTNAQGVMTRPVWTLMHRLPMFKDAPRGNLEMSEWAEAHIVNIPSSVITDKQEG